MAHQMQDWTQNLRVCDFDTHLALILVLSAPLEEGLILNYDLQGARLLFLSVSIHPNNLSMEFKSANEKLDLKFTILCC